MNKKGITLLELIITMIIVAIFAAIAIPILSGYPSKAKQTLLKAEMKDIYPLLESFIDNINQGKIEVYVINTIDNLNSKNFYHKYFIPFELIKTYVNENYIFERGNIYCLITIIEEDYYRIIHKEITFREASYEITEIIYQLPKKTIQYINNKYQEIVKIPIYKQNYLF